MTMYCLAPFLIPWGADSGRVMLVSRCATPSAWIFKSPCHCTQYNSRFAHSHNKNQAQTIPQQSHSSIRQRLVKQKRRGPCTRVAERKHENIYEEENVGISDEELDKNNRTALLRGGEQVMTILNEMLEFLQDLSKQTKESEEVAVKVAAQAVVYKHVESLESSFMMAIDFMILQASRESDEKQKRLLEVIKDTVLSYLTKKLPPHVQVVGMLCRTPRKDSRLELLRRVCAGGGTFDAEDGSKIVLPKANLLHIANQADDILQSIEEKPSVPDRRLLARLVLIREEARSMLQGGILDERNHRSLNTLPDAEVTFVSKLVSMKPGAAVRERIDKVMRGYDEGADVKSDESKHAASKIKQSRKGHPVRPGMFLQTVTKVIGGIYEANVPGVTVQHLDWVHRETLNILQDIAFS